MAADPGPVNPRRATNPALFPGGVYSDPVDSPRSGSRMALDFLSPLHKASRQISVYLESRTRELGVSPLEGHVLTYLRSYAPASIRDLVRVFGVKQSTFTSLLDRLERGGLVRRTINPDDRRSFLVHITDQGARAGEAAHPASPDFGGRHPAQSGSP